MAEGSGGALRQILARFGIEFDDKKLKEGMTSVNGGVTALRAFGAAITSSAIVVGVRSFADAFEQAGSRLQDAADSIGTSAENLQELEFAASQTGLQAGALDSALAGLVQRAEQAKSGAGPAAAAFRALGVHATDAAGNVRPVSDLMDDIASGFDRVQDPARRAALAHDLFGNAGRRLQGVLHSGAGGLASLRRQVTEFGGGMTREAIDAANAYGDSLDRWRLATMSVKSVIANALLPWLTQLVSGVTHAAAWVARMTRGTTVAHLALGALATVLAVRLVPAIRSTLSAFWPIIRAWGPWVALLAAVVLIVDDFITMMRGGDSVLGRFLDRMFGLGTSQRVVRSLREAWDGFVLAMRNGGRWLSDMWRMFRHDLSEAGDSLANLWSQFTAGAARAWQAVQQFIAPITGAFQAVWNGVDQFLGGALTRMTERVRAWIEPLLRTIRGIGQAIASPFQAGARIIGDLANDWRSLVLNDGNNANLAPSGTVTRQGAAATPGGRTTVNQRNVGPTHIEVHAPNTDPRAVAREVDRIQQARQNAQHDADHPLPPREG